MTWDDGIPGNFFGPVPELFYGIVGRIVMLSSLLEMRMLMLRSALKGGSEHEFASETAAQLVSGVRDSLDQIKGSAGSAATEVVNRVESALHTRNEIVHSVWPGPTLNNAYGWRAVGRKLRESERNAYAAVTFDERSLMELIGELVRLVEEVNRLILSIPHEAN